MCFTLLEQKHPKARKEHICEWCGEKINIGEKYYRYKGIYDGDFQDTCMHLECELASQKFFAENIYEDEFTPYEFKRGSVEEK